MKPTYNAVSPEGTKTFSTTFDTIGFFARSIEDLQLVADVFAIKDDESPKDVSLKEASVAMIKTPMWHQAGPGTVVALKNALTILQNSGVRVEEISFPTEIGEGDGEALKRTLKLATSGEAGPAFLREYMVDKTKIDPEIRRLVENHNNFTHTERIQALDKLANMRAIVDKIAANYSAIITPSALDEAPLGLEDMGSPVFNSLWTASASPFSIRSFLANLVQGFHVPVINMPAFTGAHGMPIGISLVASRFCDQHLLRISKVLSEPLMNEGSWKVKL